MSRNGTLITERDAALTSGSGAASVLASGIGACTLGVLAIAADKSQAIRIALIFYKPTGPLSGVTTATVLIWLAVWAVLEWRWRKREIEMGRVNLVAYILAGLGLLLTFPPFADIF